MKLMPILAKLIKNVSKGNPNRINYDVIKEPSYYTYENPSPPVPPDPSFSSISIADDSEISNKRITSFGNLVLKWKGSVYKLICHELIIYAFAYTIISLSYRYWFDHKQRRLFEMLCLYSERTLELVPISLFLSFYVTYVITRWWNQFSTIPWPDRLMHAIVMYVDGTEPDACLLRRTLIRYVNLSSVILFQAISRAVKRRFPTYGHLVLAGLMTDEEKILLENIQTSLNRHFVPMIWFINLLNKAKAEGRITEPNATKHLLQEVNKFRGKTGRLWCFDWVTVPLVYTQVVTLTTHLFFAACLLGRQYLDPSKGYYNHHVDFYFPFFTFFQFMFFMGWLKVAEQLINPFNEDDDDFHTNWMIDRNLQVSYIVVDDLYGQLPSVAKGLCKSTHIVEQRTKEELPNNLLRTTAPKKSSTRVKAIIPKRTRQKRTNYRGLSDYKPLPESVEPEKLMPTVKKPSNVSWNSNTRLVV